MDLIDRSKLPRIRITGFCEERLLTEVFGVLNDVIQNAPTVDAVLRDEYESLLKRFRHLLESDFIRSFDEYDPKTGTWKRDISEADTVAHVIRCGRCKYSTVIDLDRLGIRPLGLPAVAMYCTMYARITAPEGFCSEGVLPEASEVKE